MPIFWFRGRARLNGVDFEIEAANMEEARVKAKAGDIIDADYSRAELYDYEISLSSGEKDHD